MQQKLALILTRGTAQQQLSAMTSIVGHKCGFEARLPLYLYKAMCFLAVSRNGEHQPRVNKQHYVLLMIRNKNVDTNMTPSSRWFMKKVMTAELSFILSVCAAHVWREAPVRPIIGGRTEKPVTRIYMTNEEGQQQQNSNKRILKMHTCMQLWQKTNVKKERIRLQFWRTNFARRIYLWLLMKGRILGPVG